jgi:nucleoside-diphosphate-sugar epimerase
VRVMITGAAGYIGSVLTAMLLELRHEVVAVDRFFFGRESLPERHDLLSSIDCDIRELKAEVFDGVDAVVDLAAISNDPAGELDPELTFAINRYGRARVARLARQAGVSRYILPSSCSLYGSQEGVLDESSQVRPLTTYAEANLGAERAALSLKTSNFCVVVIRQATVYGVSPRMRFDLALNGMASGIATTGVIPILRDGTQWRPLVHVRDACKAITMFLHAPTELVRGQIFNVGSDDQNRQIFDLAETVAHAVQLPFKYEWYGSLDHRSYRVSFQKIQTVLGFECSNDPVDGASEVHRAILEGIVDPADPRTNTVNWYKVLLNRGVLSSGQEVVGTS